MDVAGKEVKVTFEEGTFPNLFHLPECQFSSRPPNSKTDIKMVDLMDQLPFDNINGGVWKQGFDITYSEKYQITCPAHDCPLRAVRDNHAHT